MGFVKAIPWQDVAERSGFPDTHAYLNQIYVIEGRTLTSIAEEVGCSYQSVRNQIIREGIPLRDNRKRFPTEQELRKLPPKDLNRAYLLRSHQAARLVYYIKGIVEEAEASIPSFANRTMVAEAVTFAREVERTYKKFNKDVT